MGPDDPASTWYGCSPPSVCECVKRKDNLYIDMDTINSQMEIKMSQTDIYTVHGSVLHYSNQTFIRQSSCLM